MEHWSNDYSFPNINPSEITLANCEHKMALCLANMERKNRELWAWGVLWCRLKAQEGFNIEQPTALYGFKLNNQTSIGGIGPHFHCFKNAADISKMIPTDAPLVPQSDKTFNLSRYRLITLEESYFPLNIKYWEGVPYCKEVDREPPQAAVIVRQLKTKAVQSAMPGKKTRKQFNILFSHGKTDTQSVNVEKTKRSLKEINETAVAKPKGNKSMPIKRRAMPKATARSTASTTVTAASEVEVDEKNVDEDVTVELSTSETIPKEKEKRSNKEGRRGRRVRGSRRGKHH